MSRVRHGPPVNSARRLFLEQSLLSAKIVVCDPSPIGLSTELCFDTWAHGVGTVIRVPEGAALL